MHSVGEYSSGYSSDGITIDNIKVCIVLAMRARSSS